MDDERSGQRAIYQIGVSCPRRLVDFGAVPVSGTAASLGRRKAPGSGADGFSVTPSVHQLRAIGLWVVAILVSASLSGCTVARVGRAGFSLGASAVKTTAKVGGAAVDLAGSAVGIGSDDEEKVDEEADNEGEETEGEPEDG